MKQPLQPIYVVDLFPVMRAELLRVLRTLPDDAWNLPTACAGWSVKDVALHLLADDIGYLSRSRDDDGITFKVDSWEELVSLINASNELWVQAARRISKRLLMSLLEFTGEQFYEYFRSLPPDGDGGTISWAGSGPVPMWLQIARELTEHWMHHQHICEAVGVNSLKNRRFLHPVLSTFVYALPKTYQNISAPLNTTIQLKITGEAADDWYLVREGAAWGLYADTDIQPSTVITLDDDTAWHLFTKGLDGEIARQRATITGDLELGNKFFETVAIIA
jgi:uncharacterized protein (TIGR03083 family)